MTDGAGTNHVHNTVMGCGVKDVERKTERKVWKG